MANIGTTEAASALADHFCPHLDAGREEGRRLVADALHAHFGVPLREARRRPTSSWPWRPSTNSRGTSMAKTTRREHDNRG
jgi:hypothetical protein